MKFRRRVVVVDAVVATEQEVIQTLEGDMTAQPGDWIVTGIAGERYPVKPHIFAALYEPVEEEK